MKYLVEARTVWILALLACVSILLAGASVVLGWQAYFAKREAKQVIQRADSLVADWTKRGCAPRSQTLP